MVSIQSARRSPVAPSDRRMTHFDGEGRDGSRTAHGNDTARPKATRGARILPTLPDGTGVGEAREGIGSH